MDRKIGTEIFFFPLTYIHSGFYVTALIPPYHSLPDFAKLTKHPTAAAADLATLHRIH